MAIQRMDNVLIVVDDLDAVISFFVELGMELEGKGPIEGRWVERVIGIDDVRQDVAMLRTPDGHGRIELAMFHTPKAISAEPKDAPANTLGIRRIMFAVDDIEDVVARLRTHGAELVGEIARYEDSLSALLRPRPRGHRRRAGRTAQLKTPQAASVAVAVPAAGLGNGAVDVFDRRRRIGPALVEVADGRARRSRQWKVGSEPGTVGGVIVGHWRAW